MTTNGEKAKRRGNLSEISSNSNGWFYDEFNHILYTSADIDGMYNEVVIEYTDEIVRKPIKDQVIDTGEQDIPDFIFNDSLN